MQIDPIRQGPSNEHTLDGKKKYFYMHVPNLIYEVISSPPTKGFLDLYICGREGLLKGTEYN